MNDDQLLRNLRSVGMTCFVEFYEMFTSESMSRDDVIEKLKSAKNYTEKASGTRVSNARSIILSGLANQALQMIVNSESNRILESTKIEARRLLSKNSSERI
jgi:hypothetical protein